MNTIQKQLIDVLRCFAQGTEVKMNITDAQKEELFILSKKHSVAGIVAYTLKLCDTLSQNDIEAKFAKEYERTVMQMLSREASALRICDELTQMDIPHILFKGITVSEAYPVPQLRAFADVDIIVDKTHLEDIRKHMERSGFKHTVADAGVVNAFKRHRERYEFHKELNVSNVKNTKYFSEIWGNTVARQGKTLQFNHNFHLCYLICHLEKHVYGSGAGVRMYLDIALYLNKYRNDIDIDFVREILDSCNLGKFLNTILYVCNRWFGCEAPLWVEPLDDEIYLQLCDFVFSGSVFGKQCKDDVFQDDLRREISSGKKGAKLRFFLSRVFPTVGELYRMYPKFENKPLLLPVAWFCHVWGAIKNKKLSNVKAIISADSSIAQKKNEFLSNIGSGR